MSIPEAALRGGAVAVLLLLAVLLLRQPGRPRSSVLFILSVAIHAVGSAPDFDRLALPFGLPVLIVSLGLPALFWMSAAAIFGKAQRAWHGAVAWPGLVTLGLWSIFTGVPFLDLA